MTSRQLIPANMGRCIKLNRDHTSNSDVTLHAKFTPLFTYFEELFINFWHCFLLLRFFEKNDIFFFRMSQFVTSVPSKYVVVSCLICISVDVISFKAATLIAICFAVRFSIKTYVNQQKAILLQSDKSDIPN